MPKKTPSKAAPKKAAPKASKGATRETLKPPEPLGPKIDPAIELAAKLVEKYGDLILSDVLHDEVKDAAYTLADEGAGRLKERGVESQVAFLLESGYTESRIEEIARDELGNDEEKASAEEDPQG